MGAAELNFLALPAAVLLALLGGPWGLRRAAYPWGKALFGTLALAMAALAVAGVVTAIQRKAGLENLPLAWLVPAAVVALLWRLFSRESAGPA